MTNIENLIKEYNDSYIKKLNLENIQKAHFTKSGEYKKIKYDVAKDLEDSSSEIYQKVYSTLKEGSNARHGKKEQFVLDVIEFWISEFTRRLDEGYGYFEEKLDGVNINEVAIKMVQSFKNGQKIDLDVLIEDARMDVINRSINDYYYQEQILNSYLDDIEYDQIIRRLYELDLDSIVDNLDDDTNQFFHENTKYIVDLNKDEMIYLNIMPFQDGNDEGSILGAYLDYLGTTIKDDGYSYYPYYIHKDKVPKMPECFKWFMKSQDYDSENTIDLNAENRSEFLESLRQEILNEQNSCQFLVFCIMVKIDELFKILNGQTFTIDSGTVCGFANIVHGSASGLDINLEKDIDLKINKDNCIIQVEGPEEGDSSYGYGYMLSDIWGFWDGSYSDIEIKE